MSETLFERLLLGLFFTVLLALEWRYRLRSVRMATALLALVLWFFSQPNPTRAARWAIAMPVTERVTEIGGVPLSEYASMRQETMLWGMS
jgi:hypothetical protein